MAEDGGTAEPRAEYGVSQCLYCGYALHGLPDGSVCPECGMQSVPQAMRREVWALVDSPRRLWAEMFSLWRKHPPGWWWALDRPGDRRRCLRILAINLALALSLVSGAVMIADCLSLRVVYVRSWYDPPGAGPAVPLGDGSVYEYGAFGSWRASREVRYWLADQKARVGDGGREIYQPRTFQHVAWKFRKSSFFPAFHAACWMFFLWASVSLVGLWTQIRRGLPAFAKPPRTIIAASCLESCKLVYLSLIVSFAAVAEFALRIGLFVNAAGVYVSVLLALNMIVIAIGVAGWLGALRSDFTRQLVRSRVHLVRILIMYALITPFIFLAFASGLARIALR